jgi:hypothetical protein
VLTYLPDQHSKSQNPCPGCTLYFRNVCLEDYTMFELCVWLLSSSYIIELLSENDFYLYYYNDLKCFLSVKFF